ncbi:hypothetical protein Ga0123462_1276 [Mariprofundus ferrinatatus]|uniref:Yip1 domain-containing protein n=1 Tax=Mariprofundus ferrinatatus TaxID=1921087 RepID=A0A2K8L490_9PROT|nr:hypothetical protein [Mariprofundus ferrinatatus]ATX82140.1 hypothetical protein Ga0123462_1276 [Mariprofundus ferrinatatus]
MSGRFNPQYTYYRRDKLAEVFFSIFLVALFFPKRMFKGMPEAKNLKDSAILLAMYLSIPSILMTTTFGAIASSLAPNMVVGALIFISILPVSLAIGLSTSLLWSRWLSWSLSKLSGKPVSMASVFQVCAYSGPPFVIAWGPYLGPVMALWNLVLNWKGLRFHCGLGGWKVFFAMISGILLLFLIMVAIAFVLFLFLPENVNMLLETFEFLMHQRGWL